MQTQRAQLPESFHGIDGHYYSYIDAEDAKRLKESDAANIEFVAEYEYVYSETEEDELMMDKYVMAQHGSGAGVDYEFFFMANDWVDLDNIINPEYFQAKVQEAEANRQRGILVTAAFSQKLCENTLAAFAKNGNPILPSPPKIETSDSLMYAEVSSIDPQNITRKEARERIAERINLLKEKHGKLARLPAPSIAPGHPPFDPSETLFYDIRDVEREAADKLRTQNLNIQLQQYLTGMHKQGSTNEEETRLGERLAAPTADEILRDSDVESSSDRSADQSSA